MSEAGTGGFLARWSRRKAAKRDHPDAEAPQTNETPPELPPIETLDADSDYTVFLARGVSQMVQAQALRVAWASDPAIANFRGMAEYAWDFNAPGYGDLAPGDDAAVWLRQIVRSGAKLLADDTAGPPAEPASAVRAPPLAPPAVQEAAVAETKPLPIEAPPQLSEELAGRQMVDGEIPPTKQSVAAAPAVTTPAVTTIIRRRHGGAVPV